MITSNSISVANNDNVSLLEKYFPLSVLQKKQFTDFGTAFKEWNAKINLISRKDIEHLYLHHILYSLCIAKLIRFKAGTRLADIGTGGGFPGLPLAILFPDCSFLLVDSIGKKINAVSEMAASIGLSNVHTAQERVENLDDEVDFVTGRAVSDVKEFFNSCVKLIGEKDNNSIPNGILYLKGGDLSMEQKAFKKYLNIYPVSIWFDEEFFITKSLIHLPAFH
jgi:16S rRNA (guanine527-N7)-methyltransferase